MAKKRKKKIKNPVAKFLPLVHKPAKHRDKTKYHRKSQDQITQE